MTQKVAYHPASPREPGLSLTMHKTWVQTIDFAKKGAPGAEVPVPHGQLFCSKKRRCRQSRVLVNFSFEVRIFLALLNLYSKADGTSQDEGGLSSP